MVVDAHRLAELRSLAFHARVGLLLETGQADVEDARAKVRAWQADGSRAMPYLDAWAALLSGPRDRLLDVMLKDDDHGRTLRSCTPFAGYLSPKERWAIWADIRQDMAA